VPSVDDLVDLHFAARLHDREQMIALDIQACDGVDHGNLGPDQVEPSNDRERCDVADHQRADVRIPHRLDGTLASRADLELEHPPLSPPVREGPSPSVQGQHARLAEVASHQEAHGPPAVRRR
jgi:hypothetical protein